MRSLLGPRVPLRAPLYPTTHPRALLTPTPLTLLACQTPPHIPHTPDPSPHSFSQPPDIPIRPRTLTSTARTPLESPTPHTLHLTHLLRTSHARAPPPAPHSTPRSHPAPLSPRGWRAEPPAAAAEAGPWAGTHPPARPPSFPRSLPSSLPLSRPPALAPRSLLPPRPLPLPAAPGLPSASRCAALPGAAPGFMVTRRRPLKPSGGGGGSWGTGAGRLSQSAGPGGGRAQAAAASAPPARGPARPPRRAPARLAGGGPGRWAAAAPRTHGRPGHHHPGDQPQGGRGPGAGRRRER